MSLTKASYSMITGAPINVLDFGADPTGVADSTNAFKAAIAAAGRLILTPYEVVQNGGQIIFMPQGKYLITDTLQYSSSLLFKGIGRGSCINFTPATSKNLFEPDPTKTASGVTLHGVTFEDFMAIGQNANAQNGISSTTSTTAYTEFICIRRVAILDFAGSGIYIGQLPAANGATYFNVIDQCQLSNNYINLYIDYWGGPTVVTGGYMLPSATSPYQMKNYASGTTVTGVSMDGQPTTAHVFSSYPITITGVRREQADTSPNSVAFVELQTSNNANSSFFGESLIQGGWIGQHGPILKTTDYFSTAQDAAATQPSGYYGVKLQFGTPTAVPTLTPNGNINKGLYGWTQFGSGSTMTYNTSVKALGQGSIALAVSGGGGLSSIKKTIPAAMLSAYVGSRIWVTWLVKATVASPTSWFVQLNGAGNTQPTYQIPADVTTDLGDWKLMQASLQIISASDMTIEVFLNSTTAGDIVYLNGINTYVNGFKGMPELQADVEFQDTAAPTTGTWARGDKVWNSTPSAGGTPGWVCVTAGTSGTWKAMANVAV